jgi:AcrR family transcriptional regulator
MPEPAKAPTLRTPDDGQQPREEASTPLASVIEALKRAEARGELGANEVEWSIARLSGRVRRGNPHLEGVERRDSIVRAAIAVFEREGYHRATIEAIANELFLTKASVYHYFKSKTEILDAICERASVASTAAIMDAAAEVDPPATRLPRMLDAYATACMNEPGFSVLMRHLDEVSPPVLAEVQRRGKLVETAFRRTLEDGVAGGVFETADTHIAVFGMLGALNWIYSWYRPEGRLSAHDVRDALIAQLLDGVSAAPRS